GDLPSRKYQDCRMAFERECKCLRTLDAKLYSVILDRGNCCLGDARNLRELSLAQALKLADDPQRFPDRNLDSFPRRMKILHFSVSHNHVALLGSPEP